MPKLADDPGFAAAVLNALSSHICVIDANGVIVAVNRAWRAFGLANGADPNGSDVGRHYLAICDAAEGEDSDEAAPLAAGVRAVLAGRIDHFQLEYPCDSPDRPRWFLARVTPLELAARGAVISHMDITDRKSLELELRRLAATDPLTGQANRRHFEEVASAQLARLRRFGGEAALLLLDLDHFKALNDRHGHAVGDAVLRRVAETCREVLRDVDQFARLGGEEFVALLPGIDLAGAIGVAERLRHAVGRLVVPTETEPATPTLSIGIAAIERRDRSIDDALRRADDALYQAKDAGRNRVRAARSALRPELSLAS